MPDFLITVIVIISSTLIVLYFQLGDVFHGGSIMKHVNGKRELMERGSITETEYLEVLNHAIQQLQKLPCDRNTVKSIMVLERTRDYLKVKLKILH